MPYKAILFAAFTYGMPKSSVIKICGAVPCQDAPDNRLLLCAPETVKFIGFDWRTMFWFNNQDELQQVLLAMRDSVSAMEIQNSLKNNGWRPALVETDDAVLDVLEKAKNAGVEKAAAELADLEAIYINKDDNITIYFLPQQFAEETMGKLKTYSQAVDSAQESLVVAALMIGNGQYKLSFTAPLLSRKNALRYGQVIKRK